MNRRSFFRSLATLFVAPTVLVRAANVIVKKSHVLPNKPVLAGFRGSNFLETGTVYAPYIPLIHSELVYKPENFKHYGKSINTEYYKKLIINL
jgi:hypothetical protein